MDGRTKKVRTCDYGGDDSGGHGSFAAIEGWVYTRPCKVKTQDVLLRIPKRHYFRLIRDVRRQMKATFESAIAHNGKVYYQFEGAPDQSVIDKLYEYSQRYNVDVVIDTTPLGVKN